MMPSLSRIVPAHRVTIQFTWLHRTFMNFGVFKDARMRQELSMDGHEKCRWCRKPFVESDMLTLAGRLKQGNVLLCQGCAEEATQSDRGAKR